MNTELRRTGRTTRMLRDALKAHQAGKAVYVVLPEGFPLLGYMKAEGYDEIPTSFKVEQPSFIWLNVDIETMTLKGAHPNCVLYVDHQVLEVFMSRFRRAVDLMHRGDAASEGQPEADDGAPLTHKDIVGMANPYSPVEPYEDELTDSETKVERLAKDVGKFLEAKQSNQGYAVDQRWLAIAKTDFQKAFMSLRRAIDQSQKGDAL